MKTTETNDEKRVPTYKLQADFMALGFSMPSLAIRIAGFGSGRET